MLCLTIKQGDRITIGEATVTVYYVKNKLRLAVDAPKHVRVERDKGRRAA